MGAWTCLVLSRSWDRAGATNHSSSRLGWGVTVFGLRPVCWKERIESRFADHVVLIELQSLLLYWGARGTLQFLRLLKLLTCCLETMLGFSNGECAIRWCMIMHPSPFQGCVSRHWERTRVPLAIYAFTAIWHALDSTPAFNVLVFRQRRVRIFLVVGRQQWFWRSCGTLTASHGCEILSAPLWAVLRLESVILKRLLQDPSLEDWIRNSWGDAQPCCYPWWFLSLSSRGCRGSAAHVGELEEAVHQNRMLTVL